MDINMLGVGWNPLDQFKRWQEGRELSFSLACQYTRLKKKKKRANLAFEIQLNLLRRTYLVISLVSHGTNATFFLLFHGDIFFFFFFV